jgi:hypothetical protein
MADHNKQAVAETVRITADGQSLKRLGAWTSARRFAIRGSRSSVVLDLLLPLREPGTVEISLDLDHTMLKLLVPDGAVIDAADLRRSGRGRVKDRTGSARPGGQRITLRGEMRDSEVRVHRGGIAILSLLVHGQRAAVRHANRGGRLR